MRDQNKNLNSGLLILAKIIARSVACDVIKNREILPDESERRRGNENIRQKKECYLASTRND
jgi:hypothetical protein